MVAPVDDDGVLAGVRIGRGADRCQIDAGRADQMTMLTGGLHAAAAFDRDAVILEAREDIGRHNAVDKVVGRFRLDGRLPAEGLGLFVSGRASFEMVQKAWAAGFATVVAVSAPSALAVEAAESAALQLAGFARNGTLNLYAPGGASS